MQTRSSRAYALRAGVSVLGLAALAGCATTTTRTVFYDLHAPSNARLEKPAPKDPNAMEDATKKPVVAKAPAPTLAPNYLGMPLRSGQIVLSESPYSTSFVFSLVPDKFYYFTHGAILVMEDGEPWVYETAGELATFPIHEKVLDNVEGHVMRRRLLDYAGPNLYVEIQDPPEGADGDLMAIYAREEFRKKTPFDPYFRFDDHSKLYCTEFLEMAMRAGGAKQQHEPLPVSQQPSLAVGLRWLGVPTDTALPAGIYYDPSRTVGAMGQFSNRTGAFAYFEAKREVYRRFQNPSQRLGFVFKLKSTGDIELRPQIEHFVLGAAKLFDGVADPPPWGDARIVNAVHRFADETFGPAPDAPEVAGPESHAALDLPYRSVGGVPHLLAAQKSGLAVH